MRPQVPVADLAGERRIRPVVAQAGDLVEQRHRPQVRVLGEAFADVVDERHRRLQVIDVALVTVQEDLQLPRRGLLRPGLARGGFGREPAAEDSGDDAESDDEGDTRQDEMAHVRQFWQEQT